MTVQELLWKLRDFPKDATVMIDSKILSDSDREITGGSVATDVDWCVDFQNNKLNIIITDYND